MPYLAMAVVTLVWAGNFAAGKYATAELHWALIASVRIVATAAAFALFVPRGTLAATRWRTIVPLALTGIVVNQAMFAMGIRLTTPSHSALIHAMIPVVVLVMAAAFLRERPGGRAVAGLVLAVGGAAYLALSTGAAERSATLAGDALTLVGMTSFSGYMILGRRVLATEGAFVTVTRAFAASVPFAVPMFAYGAWMQDWGAVTWKGWSALGYMIAGATFLCYSLHMWSLARLDALKVAIFTNAQPILAGLIAQALGIESVTLPLAVSAAVVIAGVVLVQTGKREAGSQEAGDRRE